LKPEYIGTPGPELADMKKRGIQIQYRLEVPLVVFLGDTTAGPVFDETDVQNAQVLITECTFYDADHRAKAKAGRHLHVEQFAEIAPHLKNEQIILTHVSRRTGIRRAKHLLRKMVGSERMKNISFLMDFEGSQDAGDVESAGPHSLEDAPE
jgi:ribonuclease Z